MITKEFVTAPSGSVGGERHLLALQMIQLVGPRTHIAESSN
jgi:hypothetical protein